MRKQIIYFLMTALLFCGANLFIQPIKSQTVTFTMSNILNSIVAIKEGRKLQSEVISDIRRRRVDFALTKENEKLLRDKGASDLLIEAIRQNSPPLPPMATPIPTPAPTPAFTPTPSPTPPSPPPTNSNTPSGSKLNVNPAVVWQKYSISEQKVNILFPQMPFVGSESDRCSDLATTDFYAARYDFAYEAIFHLRIVYESKGQSQSGCETKKRFNYDLFKARISELERSSGSPVIDKIDPSFVKFQRQGMNIWVLNDMAKKRWFEVSVYGMDVLTNEAKEFMSSLEITNFQPGIETAQGSKSVFNDNIVANNPVKDRNHLLRMIYRPRPNYTDLDKKKQTQGIVQLEVTFLASGTIGQISVIKGLPGSLTEQAIKAARGIIFIPEMKDGAFQTVTKKLEYSFTVY